MRACVRACVQMCVCVRVSLTSEETASGRVVRELMEEEESVSTVSCHVCVLREVEGHADRLVLCIESVCREIQRQEQSKPLL